MEKATLRALGDGLRKLMPVPGELPADMQAALLKIAATEMKPVVVAALRDFIHSADPAKARAI